MALKTSEETNEIAAAFAKAQAKFTIVTKDKQAKIKTQKGADYGYTFANLASVMEVIAAPLAENDLCVLAGIEQSDRQVTVTSRLAHASGQWYETDCSMACGDIKPQTTGSAITYARRYGLSALLGITFDDDDDDGGAAQKSFQNQKKEPKKQPPKKPAKPQQSGSAGPATPPPNQHDKEVASQIAHLQGRCAELKEKIGDNKAVLAAMAQMTTTDQGKLPFWKEMVERLEKVLNPPPETISPADIRMLAEGAGETIETVNVYISSQWEGVKTLDDCNQHQMKHLVKMYTAIIEGQRGEG